MEAVSAPSQVASASINDMHKDFPNLINSIAVWKKSARNVCLKLANEADKLYFENVKNCCSSLCAYISGLNKQTLSDHDITAITDANSVVTEDSLNVTKSIGQFTLQTQGLTDSLNFLAQLGSNSVASDPQKTALTQIAKTANEIAAKAINLQYLDYRQQDMRIINNSSLSRR